MEWSENIAYKMIRNLFLSGDYDHTQWSPKERAVV